MVAMMQLGGFQFGIDTAAYQELIRSGGWRWAAQDRFGARAGQQYTGPDEETISLPGVIYPDWRGGHGQLNALRALADGGKPLPLVAGDGASLGRWVVVRIDETQAVFQQGGQPRRVDFALELRRFPDAAAGIVDSPAAGVLDVAAVIPAGAAGPVEQMRGLASSTASASAGVIGGLQQSSVLVSASLGDFPAVARMATGGVANALGAVESLQDLANRALSTVGAGSLEISALNMAQNMVARANALLPTVTSAAALLRGSAVQLDAAGGPPAAAVAIQRAQSETVRAGALVKQVADEAEKVGG